MLAFGEKMPKDVTGLCGPARSAGGLHRARQDIAVLTQMAAGAGCSGVSVFGCLADAVACAVHPGPAEWRPLHPAGPSRPLFVGSTSCWRSAVGRVVVSRAGFLCGVYLLCCSWLGGCFPWALLAAGIIPPQGHPLPAETSEHRVLGPSEQLPRACQATTSQV